MKIRWFALYDNSPIPYLQQQSYTRTNPWNSVFSIIIIISFIIINNKGFGSARLRESDMHPISRKTPAPQYQPIDRKKRTGKEKTIVGVEQLRPIKKHLPCSRNRQSHTIEYGVSKIVPEEHREGNKSPSVLRGSAARRCVRIHKCTDVRPEHRV